jgi:hypothetical protein
MSHSSVNVAEISGSNALQVVHEVYGKMRSHLSMWGGVLVLLIIIVAIVISGKISDVVHAVQRGPASRGPAGAPPMQMDRYVHVRGHADFSRHHPASRESYGEGSPQTSEATPHMGHPANHSAPQPYQHPVPVPVPAPVPHGHGHGHPVSGQENFTHRSAPAAGGCPV